MMSEGASKYTTMQKTWYDEAAGHSRYDAALKADAVVGSYDAHNDWPDYDRFLMKYVDQSFVNKLAIDIGCGPGRNIVKYNHLFQRIDGVDISQNNLDNAAVNISFHNLPPSNLYVTDGRDCGSAPSNTYDFALSTIMMQHICVHEVRFSILTNVYRVLRKLGRLSMQMGFGVSEGRVPYYENYYDAPGTNSLCDTMVEYPHYLEDDLERIGFKDFEYWIRPVGPGDGHPYWIFFTAVK